MKIALDVDDVLAAFTPHAHKFHKVPLEDKVDYWCERTMDSRLGPYWFTNHIAKAEDFWRTLPVLSSPSSIDFDVAYYISSFPPEMYDLRVEWLRKNGFPEAELIVASNKLDKCRELKVNLLVDDKPATIKQLQGTEIRGIHFITSYAGFEPVGNYITSLSQLKQYL